jgi:hypothetical protein
MQHKDAMRMYRHYGMHYVNIHQLAVHKAKLEMISRLIVNEYKDIICEHMRQSRESAINDAYNLSKTWQKIKTLESRIEPILVEMNIYDFKFVVYGIESYIAYKELGADVVPAIVYQGQLPSVSSMERFNIKDIYYDKNVCGSSEYNPNRGYVDKYQLLKQTNFKCYICGRELRYGTYGISGGKERWHPTLEHIRPKSAGGKVSSKLNLLMSCGSCNQIKGSVPYSDEFRNTMKMSNTRYLLSDSRTYYGSIYAPKFETWINLD